MITPDQQKKFIEASHKILKGSPLILRTDLLGCLRLGDTPQQCLKEVCTLIEAMHQEEVDIVIPTYSYSYTKKEIYDIKNTPSTIGVINEHLRQQHNDKRTIDANFSYVTLNQKNYSPHHFTPHDYETFGPSSLIKELYNKDAYVGNIGGVFRHTTEIHHLEKCLSIPYRFDKVFSGQILFYDNSIHKQNITYFCRDLSYHLVPDFKKLEHDLLNDNLFEYIYLDDLFYIQVVRLQQLHAYIEAKVKNNPFYLCQPEK